MLDKVALIIDDSATARTMLKHKLNKFDVVVETAADGMEGLQILQTRQPDIIFLDHIMPGLDAFQVLEQLKINPLTQSIPVVMYTSQAAPKYSDEARAMGAIGVMPKQVTNDLLSQMLDRAEQYRQAALHAIANNKEAGFVDRRKKERRSLEDRRPTDSHLEAPASTHTVAAAETPESTGNRPGSLANLLLIIVLLLMQGYWLVRDQRQQSIIDSLDQQLSQQQQGYEQARIEMLEQKAANQSAMEEFQYIMDAMVNLALEKTGESIVPATTESKQDNAADAEAEIENDISSDAAAE